MNEITTLDGVFKIFEVFGFQTFSIESELNPKTENRRRVWSTLYLLLVWATFTTSLLLISKMIWEEFSETFGQEGLSFFMKFVDTTNLLVSVFAMLLLALLRKRNMIKFFKDAREISRIWKQEFNHEVNYRQLKHAMLVINVCFVLHYVVAQAVVMLLKESAYDRMLNSFRAIIYESVFLMDVQFNFYVQIIRFNLKQLIRVMSENLCDAQVVVSQENRDRSSQTMKILACRKIFFLIKKMSDEVNSAMGAVVLLMLTQIILSFLRNGFTFFMFIGGYDNGNIGGEPCLLMEVECVINTLIHPTAHAFILLFNAVAFFTIFYSCQGCHEAVRIEFNCFLYNSTQLSVKIADILNLIDETVARGAFSDKGRRGMMFRFKLQVLHNPPKFPLCGFATIDFGLLGSVSTNRVILISIKCLSQQIIAAIISYQVLLIQFNSGG